MKKVEGANAPKGSKIYVYNQWYEDQDITPPEKNKFELHNVRGYTIKGRQMTWLLLMETMEVLLLQTIKTSLPIRIE
jgi:hypothetical protein